MPKSKRENILLRCSVCQEQNYITSKNPTNLKDKLILKKFCSRCRKHTEHQEIKISKAKKK